MKAVLILRWFARVSSLASLAPMIVLATTASRPPSLTEAIGLVFFPIGVVAGFILAWLHEGVGGAITMGSLAVFYAWMLLLDGQPPHGPWFFLMAAPGLVFLVTWLVERLQRGKEMRPAT